MQDLAADAVGRLEHDDVGDRVGRRQLVRRGQAGDAGPDDREPHGTVAGGRAAAASATRPASAAEHGGVVVERVGAGEGQPEASARCLASMSRS